MCTVVAMKGIQVEGKQLLRAARCLRTNNVMDLYEWKDGLVFLTLLVLLELCLQRDVPFVWIHHE